MKRKLVIIGISRGAKQVYDFIRIHDLYEIVGFTVDEKYIEGKKTHLGFPLFPLESLDSYIDRDNTQLFVSLGWNRLNADRKEMYERIKTAGYSMANLISPTAIVRGKLDGDNIWINDYAVLQSDTVIKSNVQIREHVVIGNETIIEEHVFVAIKGLIAGGCIVGKQSFIGINATVFDGTIIGEKCIVGGSSIVKRNMAPYSLCKTKLEYTENKIYSDDIIESKLLTSRNVR